MSNKSELIAALTEFVQTKSGVQHSVVCNVVSVDSVNKTCYCRPLNGDADIYDVRLIADYTKDGFILYPAVDSTVVVTFESEASAYVSMVSKVTEIHLAGVNYGGLGKTSDIATKLNNLENKVNALIAAFNAWVVVPNDGGAALKVAAAVSFSASSLTLTTQANISSNKVYHGDAT